MKRYLSLLLWLILIGQISFAQSVDQNALDNIGKNIYVNEISGPQLARDSVLIVRDDHMTREDRLSSNVKQTVSVEDLVILEIRPDAGFHPNRPFNVNVQLELESRNDAGELTKTEISLHCNYDTTNVNLRMRDLFQFSNGSVNYFRIAAIETSNPEMMKYVYLRSEIHSLRILMFDCNIRVSTLSLNDDFNTHQEITVDWPALNGAEYELEWTFLDANAPEYSAYPSMTDQERALLFLNNATRVTTSYTSYTIKVGYPAGKVIYRVRPIQLQTNLAILHGPWTNDAGNYFECPGLELEKNWTFKSVFAEEGKRNTRIEYFDGLGRNRQFNTINESMAASLIGNTYYNKSGFKAISTLPAPYEEDLDVPGRSIKFFTHFNADGTMPDPNISADDIPNSVCEYLDLTFSPNRGAGRYYSVNSEFKEDYHAYTPDAEGYPYSLSIYTNDNTGRLAVSTAPGRSMSLGTGHENKYFYVSPSQEELYRIFASDVGDAKFYNREYVMDPNGQLSVTYKDGKDRVIATALAGENPEVLSQLGYKDEDIGRLTIDLTRYQYVKDDLIELTYNIMVTTPGTYDFNYLVDEFPRVDLPGCNENEVFCYHCKYDIQIDLLDNCGERLYSTDLKNYSLSAPLEDCRTPASHTDESFSYDFSSVGQYTLRKMVTLNEDMTRKYTDHYIKSATCSTYQDFLLAEFEKLDLDNCDITCEECLASIGPFEDYRLDGLADYRAEDQNHTDDEFVPGLPQYDAVVAIYNELISNCDELCNNESSLQCNSFFEAMLADVSPGGQYFPLDDDGNPDCSGPNAYSVVACSTGTGLLFQDAALHYINSDGSDAIVEDNVTGEEKTPNELTPAEFNDAWDPNWAYTLVKKHPEYCLYEQPAPGQKSICEEISIFREYDKEMLAVTSFDEAVTKGYIDANGHINWLNGTGNFIDPLLNSAYLGSLLPSANEIMDVINVSLESHPQPVSLPVCPCATYSIVNLAYFLINNASDNCNDLLCGPCSGVDLATICSGEKNYIWKFIRAYYIYEKSKYYSQLRREFAASHCPEVNIIGCKISDYDKAGFNGLTHPNSNVPLSHFEPRFLLAPVNMDMEMDCPAISDEITTQALANANDVCEGYLTDWQYVLSQDCGVTFPSALGTDILNGFMAICTTTVSTATPFGLNVNPALAPDPTSFADVLTLAGVSCSDLFFTMPPAPSQTQPVSPFVYSNLPTVTDPPQGIPECTCHDLQEFLNDFLALEDIDDTYSEALKEQFATYMQANYDAILTPQQWDDLIKMCNGDDCRFLSQPTELPYVLRCPACYSCEEVKRAMHEFKTSPEGIQYANDNRYHHLLVTYLNRQFGFHYSIEEYYQFIESCRECDGSLSCEFDITPAVNSWIVQGRKIPLALFLNDAFNVTYDIAQWTILFEECSLDPSELFLKKMDCSQLEIAINNYLENVSVADPNWFSQMQLFFNTNYDQTAGILFTQCQKNFLWEVTPNICNLMNQTAQDILSLNPDLIIFKTDSIIDKLRATLFPGHSRLYVKNMLFICGIVLPEGPEAISCDQLYGYYQSWLTHPGPTFVPFGQYVNNITGWTYTPVAYINAIRHCSLKKKCKLCFKDMLQMEQEEPPSCMEELMLTAEANAQNAWEEYLLAQEELFTSQYVPGCLDALHESFTMTYEPREYHFTLYYYDRAGNLVATVPPQGVRFLKDTEIQQLMASPALVWTFPHKMVTKYEYNTVGQVIKQETPDAGISEFWYDALGRVVLSQNAKQRVTQIYNPPGGPAVNTKFYSYSLYDALGRVKEAGKVRVKDPTTLPFPCTYSVFETFLTTHAIERTEVARTFYDDEVITFSPSQENLTNRVSASTFSEKYDPLPSHYDNAIHYSYDISGNVKRLYQENKNQFTGHEIKTVDYRYDLISGKVNKVIYQESVTTPSKPDQFIHEYHYDADNRIRSVEISTNGVDFTREADYTYYLHGPLARTLLGEQKVQGLDYAYSIQGWLKGVNSSLRQAWNDIGRDGWVPTTGSNLHGDVARDAFAFTLRYHEGDYQPVGQPADHVELGINNNNWMYTNTGDLYNGNIMNMTVDLQGLNPGALGSAYRYDQLNRLKSVYTQWNPSYYYWNWDINSYNNQAYDETDITYDKNGNILLYKKYDETGTLMDDMRYSYHYSGGNLVDNKLDAVYDPVDKAGTEDFSNPNLNTTIYAYDEIGNLKSDFNEHLNIFWNNTGKVDSVENGNFTALRFIYNSLGQRIEKRYYYDTRNYPTSRIVTYYVPDAQGNVLATYRREQIAQNPTTFNDDLYLTDWTMYGSARLGTSTVPDNLLASNNQPISWLGPVNFVNNADKRFELTNHLGNVLATITGEVDYIDTVGMGNWQYTRPQIRTVQDYYAFGMLKPDRTISAGEYRFGFNGQEKTDEISGSGNHYTAEYWEMDPRIARRWNTDPVIKYHESPYAILGNNPIWFADPLGSDTITFNKSSWSAPAPKSGLDNVQFKPLGGSSNSIDVRVAEGKDVFFYNQTHTSYDEDGNATTTSSTQQFYPVEDHKNGITETPYFFGLLSYKDNDRLTLAKLAPTELLDYLADKNTGWDKMAFRGAKALQSTYGVFEFAKTISEVTVGFGGFSLGARSLTALRTIRSGEIYNFGATAASHMANPARRVPLQLMDDVIRNTKGFPDPQGSSALMYYSKMYKNGKAYNLEILYDKASNSIWHFKYK